MKVGDYIKVLIKYNGDIDFSCLLFDSYEDAIDYYRHNKSSIAEWRWCLLLDENPNQQCNK